LTFKKMNGFQDIMSEVRRRVTEREWPPGEMIPNEQDLAKVFGCSRATVNRALRELAGHGLLDRRRKAGTRVVLNPVRKAVLSISIMRHEIEKRGLSYGYLLLTREQIRPPLVLSKSWGVPANRKLLHLRSLYLGNSNPFAFEDRWINTAQVPDALTADFEHNNSNEWLVQNAPFSHGDITFSAANAGALEGEYLDVQAGTALFVMDRRTWSEDAPITSVRVYFAPGYRMHTTI